MLSPDEKTYLNMKSIRRYLTLEGEAGAELVARLVKFLRIEGAANAEGQAAVDLGVVGEGGDAAVVDLGLFKILR
jgi:hypothetical protein